MSKGWSDLCTNAAGKTPAYYADSEDECCEIACSQGLVILAATETPRIPPTCQENPKCKELLKVKPQSEVARPPTPPPEKDRPSQETVNKITAPPSAAGFSAAHRKFSSGMVVGGPVVKKKADESLKAVLSAITTAADKGHSLGTYCHPAIEKDIDGFNDSPEGINTTYIGGQVGEGNVCPWSCIVDGWAAEKTVPGNFHASYHRSQIIQADRIKSTYCVSGEKRDCKVYLCAYNAQPTDDFLPGKDEPSQISEKQACPSLKCCHGPRVQFNCTNVG